MLALCWEYGKEILIFVASSNYIQMTNRTKISRYLIGALIPITKFTISSNSGVTKNKEKTSNPIVLELIPEDDILKSAIKGYPTYF